MREIERGKGEATITERLAEDAAPRRERDRNT
jgi:hypothetical protein